MAKKKATSLFKKTVITLITGFLGTTSFFVGKDIIAPTTVTLPASNGAVSLYSNQTNDKLDQLYFTSIEKAKECIHLVIYALMDEKVIEKLQKKCEEGVAVYIVCDAKASPGITRKLPKATIIRRVADGLVHQKILVIDQKEIVLGSANLTYSSLHIHGNLVMALSNKPLADALTERIKKMDDQGTSLPIFTKEMEAGGQHVELWILPNDPAGVDRMIKLFRAAKKSIKVAMFTWTRQDFTEELIAASKRGVKVEVTLDRCSSKGASSKILAMLQKASIPVMVSTGKGLLHHKFAYIDSSILVNGSANWTASAFKTNDDYFVILNPLTEIQRQKMDCLWTTIQNKSALPQISKKKK